ncbi:MAG: ParA family protein, partial [Dokdonella sp.]
SHGKPINLYDRESRGAIAYLGLAGEMLRRERTLPSTAPTAS